MMHEYESPEPTPKEEAEYYEQQRTDDNLYLEVGKRAWFALVYFNPIDDEEAWF